MENRGRIMSFENQGLVFDVSDTGPLEGETVVLLHGFPERKEAWEKVSRQLNRSGYRTLAPDQRGYSAWARPSGRSAYAISHLVSDIHALLDRIDGPVHLVGHDWGAMVAWSVAIRYPGRLRTLTTVSVPHPAAFNLSLLSSRQLWWSYYMLIFQLPFLPELLTRRAPGLMNRWLKYTGMSDAQIAGFHREIVGAGALTGALNWYRAIPWSLWQGDYGKVEVPTTHVWSDGDVALARHGAELTRRYVTAPYKLEVLQGISHWIPDEAAGALASIVLDRIAGR